MSGVRFTFGWKVPRTGYKWIQATKPGQGTENCQPALVEAAQVDPGAGEADVLDPEPHPVLFRLFALIPADENGILKIANRFGDLGTAKTLTPALPGTGRKAKAVEGTLLSTWKGQIAAVDRLSRLWDLIQRDDACALTPYIRWEPTTPEGPTAYFDSAPAEAAQDAPSLGDVRISEPIGSVASDARLKASYRTGDVVVPAKIYLQTVLDLHLHHAADDVKVGMTWDARREQPVLSYWCPTLLAAVWTQFATVVSENLTFGSCRECGRWFEIAPNVARASRRFCSIACRSKAYRERQERARRMHAEGMAIPEIADALDSNMGAVRRWITGVKE
jgi:hypothetical protein